MLLINTYLIIRLISKEEIQQIQQILTIFYLKKKKNLKKKKKRKTTLHTRQLNVKRIDLGEMSNRRKETHCFWLLVSVIGTRVLIISTRTDTRGESAWIRRHQQHVKTHDKETLEPETVRVYTTTNADGPVSGGRPASSMHNDTSFSCLEAFCQSHLAGNRRLPSVYNRFHPLEKWHRRFFVHFYTICIYYMQYIYVYICESWIFS